MTEKDKGETKLPPILSKLLEFRKDLLTYTGVYLKMLLDSYFPSDEQFKRLTELLPKVQIKLGSIEPLINELANMRNVDLNSTWINALDIATSENKKKELSMCLQATNKAIGKLEDDIRNGRRDPNTGERIGVISTKINASIRPKAFIAHEGETRTLTILKEFLEALEIQYFIAESKASSGRSIERQVDWTQSKADFAICLATKGKAINKKTGKHYMAPNIIDELGRARQVFGNKIILLVQKGVEVHTNIREIVYETFTTTNMERALIKIAKELTNWGFITAGTIKEQT